MRYLLVLPVLLLAACADDSMTRTFSLSRDSAPQTVTGGLPPLSTPPALALRPIRPVALTANQGNAQAADQTAGSAGQDALVEAAGPPATAHIRTAINESSGLAYPDPGFVDQLMNWTPPPGYTPVITQASGGGWFSRMF
jgi:hypothetical protein